MHCKKKKKERQKNERGSWGAGGGRHRQENIFGSKANERREKGPDKKQKDRTNELRAALGQRAATWECEEIKGCSEGNAKRRCKVATWPRCGKERQLKCNICTIDSWLESNQLGGRTPKQPYSSGERKSTSHQSDFGGQSGQSAQSETHRENNMYLEKGEKRG